MKGAEASPRPAPAAWRRGSLPLAEPTLEPASLLGLSTAMARPIRPEPAEKMFTSNRSPSRRMNE
jgi:hypothetical protein